MDEKQTDLNLLFGLIAMQSDLIDMRQFVDACTLWGSRKQSSLAEILVEQKWLLPEDRQHVEYLLKRRMQKADGDARKSLAGMPEGLRDALEQIGDAGIKQSLSGAVPDRRLTTSIQISPADRAEERLSRRGLHSTGGIGHVWLAHDNLLDRDVALKELKADQAGSEINRLRFFREAQITAQLTHPGTVPVYDFVADGGRSYYTMKFVKGRTLAEIIAEYHRWRQENSRSGVTTRLVQLLTQFVSICQTVAFAHSRGIIHRDLKSENVIVGDFGEVVVLDWGLAKRLQDEDIQTRPSSDEAGATMIATDRDLLDVSQTMQGEKLGTPAYMAPEQARGEIGLIDARTDVYGLAAILYELLVGEPPFGGSSIVEVLEHVIHDRPAPPGDRVDGIPQELEQICLLGLSKKRDDRPQTAVEMGDQIQAWIAERAERKRTEQERERFFNLSLDLLTILDASGALTQTNAAWERLLGWTAADLQGKHVLDLIDPADHPRARKNHERILSGEPLTEIEYRCICRDGSYRWVSWNAQLIPGESTIYLVGRDITERKRAERTFQELLESAPDAMVVVNGSGNIVLVNAQLERIFGRRREELLGGPIESLVPEQSRAGHPAKVAGFFANPVARPLDAGLELYGERPDGSTFPVEISLSPVETEQGLLVSCAVRSLEHRRKEERKIQAILDAAPDAMVVVDRNRRIVRVNQQTEETFQYSRSELVGEAIEILIPERYRAGHPAKFAEFASAPRFRPMGQNLELSGRRKDGTEFPAEISLSHVLLDDEALFISTIRDLSHRQSTERSRR